MGSDRDGVDLGSRRLPICTPDRSAQAAPNRRLTAHSHAAKCEARNCRCARFAWVTEPALKGEQGHYSSASTRSTGRRAGDLRSRHRVPGSRRCRSAPLSRTRRRRFEQPRPRWMPDPWPGTSSRWVRRPHAEMLAVSHTRTLSDDSPGHAGLRAATLARTMPLLERSCRNVRDHWSGQLTTGAVARLRSVSRLGPPCTVD